MRWLLLLLPILVSSTDSLTGAYVRLNQKGVDYFANLTSEALFRLLNNVTLPKMDVHSLVSLTPHFNLFTMPRISAKFLPTNGVRARVNIDSINVTAHTEVSALLFTITEDIEILAEEVAIDVILRFGRNHTTNENIIIAEKCDVIDPKTALFFISQSDIESYKDTFIDGMKGALRKAVCTTAIDALNFIDEQHVQQEDPSSDPSDGLSAAQFAEDLCADDTVSTTPAAAIATPIQSGPPWAIDLTMTLPPHFTTKDVTFGVNGGVLLATMAARDVPPPVALDATLLGKKMIGVMVTDFVPNTFLSHVFDFGIGEVDYQIRPEHLPASVKSLARLLCSGCHLQVIGSLTRKPRVEIDERLGARVVLSANVTVLFHGKQTSYDVIDATTDMHITLKPTIRNSRVYGDVALTSADFDIKTLGMTGALAAPLERFMSFVVPRTLWPTIRKRLRVALHQRGVKLPVLCGVSLHDFSLAYTNRAAVLQSDLTFDLDLFLRKFKAYVNRKTEGALIYS